MAKDRHSVEVKDRDIWSNLADFLGNMILKYYDRLDLDTLPTPHGECAEHRFYRLYKLAVTALSNRREDNLKKSREKRAA